MSTEQSKYKLKSVFGVRDINYTQAIEGIKSEVEFKGFNIWILICSILICSLGLNMNSTAVVIGAMLISPLMGPIVGLGLGIGTYDRILIFSALKNFTLAVIISLFTAFIFFKIMPTNDAKEILARTKPTVLDLFVAFFGGIAGVLAVSKNSNTTVVPGVAIATALMPPLCTAGYGLAIGNWDYLAGASYLFLLNCIMISLAASLVVVYLRYPKFSFINAATMKKVKFLIILVVIIIALPSVYFYYNLLNENFKKDQIDNFIDIEIESRPGIFVSNKVIENNKNGTLIRLNINGTHITNSDLQFLDSQLIKYHLGYCDLEIIQSQPVGFEEQRLSLLKRDILQELYSSNEKSMISKDQEIDFLQSVIQKFGDANFLSEKVMRIAKTQYPIENMGIDIIVYSSQEKLDTLPTALVSWKSGLTTKEKATESAKLSELIKIELGVERVKIVELD